MWTVSPSSLLATCERAISTPRRDSGQTSVRDACGFVKGAGQLGRPWGPGGGAYHPREPGPPLKGPTMPAVIHPP